MLRGVQYQESQIATILTQSEQGLFGDEKVLPEAEQEMFSHIQSNHRGGIRTTVKLLLEKFERKPYGWSYASVLCTLAYLCARGKIEVLDSTNLLDESSLGRALKNSNTHATLILNPQVEFTPGQTKKLKEFFNDYFNQVAHSTEAKALAKETKAAFSQQKIQLESLHGQSERYPFLRVLTSIIDEISELEAKPYEWFLTELSRDEDKWIDDYKEGVIDPVLRFMKGSHKTQLDDANGLLQDHKANLSYVQSDELAAIKSAVVDPNIYKGKAIQLLVSNIQVLNNKLDKAIDDEKLTAINKIKDLESKLSQYEDYIGLGELQKDEIKRAFVAIKKKVEDEFLIAVVRDAVNDFEKYEYDSLLQKIEHWNAPSEPVVTLPINTSEDNETGGVNEESPKPYRVEPKASSVRVLDLTVKFSKIYLESEDDVDDYLKSYKSTLIETLQKGKKVRV
jgi:hypothetical protein